eukprot:TRINITY_DN7546_c1_g1_i1.p3 TRINITY_DN7546_c1_g1~~TRINITY_DN7546_c1_g1_i1.p3  ORF type:complete len:102 (+),score=16.91 TRINITY_DN7546_c1_g1_i1:43-348(+)
MRVIFAFALLFADAEGDDPLRVTIRWPGGVAPTVIEGTVDSIGNQVLHIGPCSVVDHKKREISKRNSRRRKRRERKKENKTVKERESRVEEKNMRGEARLQ